MARDIENRPDLEQLLTEFYLVAMSDAQIGHFFTQVVRLDLNEHLPGSVLILCCWLKITLASFFLPVII